MLQPERILVLIWLTESLLYCRDMMISRARRPSRGTNLARCGTREARHTVWSRVAALLTLGHVRELRQGALGEVACRKVLGEEREEEQEEEGEEEGEGEECGMAAGRLYWWLAAEERQHRARGLQRLLPEAWE
eukprot:147135-Rhodomonas_salina.1